MIDPTPAKVRSFRAGIKGVRGKGVEKVGKRLISHRYNSLSLLPSGPGEVQEELVV